MMPFDIPRQDGSSLIVCIGNPSIAAQGTATTGELSVISRLQRSHLVCEINERKEQSISFCFVQ